MSAKEDIVTAAAEHGWTLHKEDKAYMVSEWRRRSSYVYFAFDTLGRVRAASSNNHRILGPDMATKVLGRLAK